MANSLYELTCRADHKVEGEEDLQGVPAVPFHSQGWAEGAAGQHCSPLQTPPSHTFREPDRSHGPAQKKAVSASG